MNGSGAEIAIVGASLRLPGARDLDQLWRNLRSGVESISRLSREQLLAAGLPVALIDHPRYVPAHATIDDIDRFDAALFGFTPREAELIDPQQRMFLECAWEALEHAGYNPQSYSAVVGVFAGATRSSYLAGAGAGAELSESMQVFVGNERDFLPTQVSYQLDLTGPSINVQTACSTSLVAVHLACQSLLSGECDVALAGGVSVHVPQDSGYLYQPGMILSPDGRCRTFSKDAAGTVSGSGLAVIVLKRLADALDDGSRVTIEIHR